MHSTQVKYHSKGQILSCVAVKSYISCFSYPVLNKPCIYLVQISVTQLTKEISQDILHMFIRYVDFIQTKNHQT